ncbi:MAG: FtsH protease activity modulator HflK [Phycisphaerae bacterium]
MLKQFFNRTQGSARLMLLGLAAVIIIGLLNGSFYTVNTDEKGVVTRFGKLSRSTDPGLHFKLPFGIEQVQTPKVKKVYKEEFGFRTLQAGIESSFAKNSYNDESIMLCGDLSVADVEWVVQYQISNPAYFLFNIRNHVKLLRDVSEAVMRSEVGDSSVDEVLTERRAIINDIAKSKMQTVLDNYDSGIRIVAVRLQDVNPPQDVKHAFNEVNAAQQDKERLENSARKEYNEIIPRTRGEAQQMVSQANAYAVERVNEAEGDAERFMKVYEAYKTNKAVTRQRMYIEAMNKIYPTLGSVTIIDEEVKSILPHLDLKSQDTSGKATK